MRALSQYPCHAFLRSLRRPVYLLVGLAAMACAIGGVGQRRISGFTRSYGPAADLRIKRPTLIWEVWPGDGLKMTKLSMSVDGQVVKASYDESLRRLAYRPDQGFSLGPHRVVCDAMVEDLLPLHQEWNFQVADGALDDLPQPNGDQVAEVASVNSLREHQKLSPASIDQALCAVAQAHSDYMAGNGTIGHGEANGVRPSDRLAAYGFVGSAFESVGYISNGTKEETIQGLFDAPYHRIPFMQPGAVLAGAGVNGKKVTLEFSATITDGIQTSPSEGQTGVPAEWDGVEEPNPLEVHGASGHSGYPIVIASFGEKTKLITDGTASLADSSGHQVDCWLNTPHTDGHLHNALFLIPKARLAPASYTASAKVTLADGSTKELTWHYTVGS